MAPPPLVERAPVQPRRTAPLRHHLLPTIKNARKARLYDGAATLKARIGSAARIIRRGEAPTSRARRGYK